MSADSARRHLLLGAALAATGGVVAWRAWQHRSPAWPAAPIAAAPAADELRAATRVDDARPLPEFALTSTHGPLTRASLAGRWSVLFFGYTQCPDVCPTSLGLLAEALRQLPAAQRPQVLFVSLDPARDTLDLLAPYMAAFDASFIGATGRDEDTATLRQHLGVSFERHAPDAAGHYTLDHTAALFLIDPQTRLKAVFGPPQADAAAVAADLRRLTA